MSSPPLETRSQRRRAANGGVDPERRSIDPLTHRFLPSRSEPQTPTRTQFFPSSSELQTPTRTTPRGRSRRDRSSSPFDPERAYRTQESVEPQADAQREIDIYRTRTPVPGQFGKSSSTAQAQAGVVAVSSTPIREALWVSATPGMEPLDAATLVDAAVVAESDRVDEREHRDVTEEREHRDVTEERDAHIRESIEDSQDEDVAEDTLSIAAKVEALRSHIKTIGLQNQTPSEHLVKRSGPTYGRPIDKNPLPVSDAFLQSLLPLGETVSDLSNSTSEATKIPSPPTELEIQATASHHSTNHSPPFTWCSHPHCPITIPIRHHAGLFLQNGTIPPREPNPIWGWSDPPANVWRAYEKWEQGGASLAEAGVIDGFMEAHACYDSLFSESSQGEGEGMEE